MIGNIESTKAMIERMSPDQLRQFAMMNSNDMIAMSLVSSVQSMRNKEKMNQQAQQTNAQPPKVAEQLINSIQPEQSGIAALPAQNMAMADGGIVGYAGDEGSLVVDPMGGVSSSEGMRDSTSLSWPSANQMLEAAGLMSPENRKAAEELEDFKRRQREGKLTDAEKRKLGMAVDSTPNVEPGRTQTASTRPGNLPPKVAGSSQTAPRTAARPQAPARTQAPEAAPAPTKSIEDYFKEAQKSSGVGSAVDPYATQRAENAALLKAQGEEELESSKTRKAGLMALMKPREERIAQREAALEKQGETDKAMAIINAGLSMMQSTGKGLSGIAEGAQKGMAQYGASMALSKAERQKISDARDAYDEFKFNAENMSDKEISASKRKIVEGTVAASEKAIQAIMDRENISRAEAAAKFKAMVEQSQEAAKMASAEKIAKEGNVSREKIAREGNVSSEKIANIRSTLVPSEAKPITYNEAADNISKWMESMAGMSYISKIQKEAKAAGKPVPDAMEIRSVLIQREMGRQPTVPPQAGVSAPTITPAQAAALAKYGVK